MRSEDSPSHQDDDRSPDHLPLRAGFSMMARVSAVALLCAAACHAPPSVHSRSIPLRPFRPRPRCRPPTIAAWPSRCFGRPLLVMKSNRTGWKTSVFDGSPRQRDISLSMLACPSNRAPRLWPRRTVPAIASLYDLILRTSRRHRPMVSYCFLSRDRRTVRWSSMRWSNSQTGHRSDQVSSGCLHVALRSEPFTSRPQDGRLRSSHRRGRPTLSDAGPPPGLVRQRAIRRKFSEHFRPARMRHAANASGTGWASLRWRTRPPPCMSTRISRRPLAATPGDGTRVSAETWRRVACDGGPVIAVSDAPGQVLDVGRRTRAIPAATRRAMLLPGVRIGYRRTAREDNIDVDPRTLRVISLCIDRQPVLHYGGATP